MGDTGAGGPAVDVARLRSAERGENFPVALRVLPARVRRHLRAVYDVVRTIDDLGDDPSTPPARRRENLDAFAADLTTLWSAGTPREEVVRHLGPTATSCALPLAPFEDLLEANRRDQRVAEYGTRDELIAYCALSAAPIGRLILAVAAADRTAPTAPTPDLMTPELLGRSDRVCTALQLLEHWADVGEDRRDGRVYLPADDRAAYVVDATDLDAPVASIALRRLVLHETAWACELLADGPALLAHLRGWARLAVAGYVAGGRAAADALVRTGGDVLGRSARTRRRDVARHLLTMLVSR